MGDERDPAASDELLLLANKQLRRGHSFEAARLMEELLTAEFESVPAAKYEQWLQGGVKAFTGPAEELRAALIHIYLGNWSAALPLLPVERNPVERAHVLMWQGQAAATQPGRADLAQRYYGEAAELLQAADRPVATALLFEKAGELIRAAWEWKTLLGHPRLNSYERALVQVNLCLLHHRLLQELDASVNQQRRVHEQATLAQQQLEELADGFESRGLQERAVDCYRVLLQLGAKLQRTENLCEGFINCIRVLRQVNLKAEALQCYQDLFQVASRLGEHLIAAETAREAADYLRRSGPVGETYLEFLRGAARAYQAAAQALVQSAQPVELAERAYLSAIESASALLDFAQVGACFVALSKLPLPSERQTRYLELAKRYPQPEQAAATPTVAAPPETAADTPLLDARRYPPVWQQDLMEWETAGCAAPVCLGLLGDLSRPSLVRRHALTILLRTCGPPLSNGAAQERLYQSLVQSLASLRSYEALAVLERLVADSHPPKSPGLGLSIKGLGPPSSKLRLAVLGVLPKLPYKRSLGILQQCLSDPDPEVRKRAREVLALLSFPDAISPLCRLFRSGAERPVRTAILTALARASDPVATEFLLDVVRQEPEPLRSLAAQLLRRVERAVLLPLLRSRLQTEPAPEPGTDPSAPRSLLLVLWQDVQPPKTL